MCAGPELYITTLSILRPVFVNVRTKMSHYSTEKKQYWPGLSRSIFRKKIVYNSIFSEFSRRSFGFPCRPININLFADWNNFRPPSLPHCEVYRLCCDKLSSLQSANLLTDRFLLLFAARFFRRETNLSRNHDGPFLPTVSVEHRRRFGELVWFFAIAFSSFVSKSDGRTSQKCQDQQRWQLGRIFSHLVHC